MSIDRHETRRLFRVTALSAVIWFTLFVVLVPIFHRHADEFSGGGGTIASQTLTSAHDTGASTPVFHRTHGLLPPADDDCPLCDWFTLGFAPLAAFTLLTVAAALVQLLFDVRRAELCRRPLPRRGLRAPPAVLLAS